MRIITGDECGLLKEFVPKIAQKEREKNNDKANKSSSSVILPVHYDRMQNINNRFGIRRIENGGNGGGSGNSIQSRVKGVVDMTEIQVGHDSSSGSFGFATLRADGTVELWKSSSSNNNNSSNNYERVTVSHESSSDGHEVEMDIFESVKYNNNPIPTVPVKPLAISSLPSSEGKLVACDTHGNLIILNTFGGSKISVVDNFCAYDNLNSPDNVTLTYTPGKVINTQLATAMAVTAETAKQQVAVGGRERDVRLLDLNTGGKCVWKAKNLPPDPQTLLQQPIFVSSMTFLQSQSSNLLAVGTGFGQVRIYDVRTSTSQTRRPVMFTPSSRQESQNRITAIASTGENEIVTGDTTGDLHSLDLRYGHFVNNMRSNNNNRNRIPSSSRSSSSSGRYIGPAGSIKQLIKHPTKPVLACVGYDRILRTYNTQTHKVIDCVYLKQRLNCALLIPDQDDNDEEEDDDEQQQQQQQGNDNSDIEDQEDVVEDYVDSDEEQDDNDNDDSDDDDDDDDNQKITTTSNKKGDKDFTAAVVEHSSSSDTSSDNSDDDDEEEKDSSSSDDDDNQVETGQEGESPRKRRRR